MPRKPVLSQSERTARVGTGGQLQAIQNHSGRGEMIFLLSLFFFLKREVKKYKRCRNMFLSPSGESQVTTNSGGVKDLPPHSLSSVLKGSLDNNQMPSHVKCPEATLKHPAHQRVKAAKEPDAAALKISSAAWHLQSRLLSLLQEGVARLGQPGRRPQCAFLGRTQRPREPLARLPIWPC